MSETKVVYIFDRDLLKEDIIECFERVLEKRANPSEGKMEQEWLSEPQARELLQVSKTTLWSYRSKGLPFSKIGNKIYYKREDINQFILNHF